MKNTVRNVLHAHKQMLVDIAVEFIRRGAKLEDLEIQHISGNLERKRLLWKDKNIGYDIYVVWPEYDPNLDHSKQSYQVKIFAEPFGDDPSIEKQTLPIKIEPNKSPQKPDPYVPPWDNETD